MNNMAANMADGPRGQLPVRPAPDAVWMESSGTQNAEQRALQAALRESIASANVRAAAIDRARASVLGYARSQRPDACLSLVHIEGDGLCFFRCLSRSLGICDKNSQRSMEFHTALSLAAEFFVFFLREEGHRRRVFDAFDDETVKQALKHLSQHPSEYRYTVGGLCVADHYCMMASLFCRCRVTVMESNRSPVFSNGEASPSASAAATTDMAEILLARITASINEESGGDAVEHFDLLEVNAVPLDAGSQPVGSGAASPTPSAYCPTGPIFAAASHTSEGSV